MKRIRPIIVGLGIGIAVFLVFGMSYRIGRHLFELTDEVVIFNEPVSVVWQDAEMLPPNRGLVILTPLVASKAIRSGTPPEGIIPDVVHFSGENVQFVNLESNDTIQIESDLVSRQIINRFGTEICSWRCSVSGSLDLTNDQYFLSVSASGGGDAGYTVTFAVENCGNLVFTLDVVERLWEGDSRSFSVRFRINDDGTIADIANSHKKANKAELGNQLPRRSQDL